MRGAIHSTKIPTGQTGKSGPPQKVDPFFETFPVGPNRSIEFWTEIFGNFRWMDSARGKWARVLEISSFALKQPAPASSGRNSRFAILRTKLRHRQSHKLTWAPATSRRSLVEFQMIGDRVRHSLSALWTSQVLHISIYSACSAEEWPVILLYKEAKIKETEFIHLPRRLFSTPC